MCLWSGSESVKFFGYVVSGFSLAPDEEKVAAVKNWPLPQTVSENRRFLGFANFFRRFIKNYSVAARPLEELTVQHTRFTWSPSCQVAFERFKGLLLSAPVLKLADASKPFGVITDASNCAVGGVLLQEEEAGQWHPVAYTSRTLSAAERNYHAMERETLAVVHALRVWKLYLNNSFEVLTDNMGVTYIKSKKDLSKPEARWMEFLSEIDLTILHRPGTNNMADALPRRPDLAWISTCSPRLAQVTVKRIHLPRTINTKCRQSLIAYQDHRQMLFTSSISRTRRHSVCFCAGRIHGGFIFRKEICVRNC